MPDPEMELMLERAAEAGARKALVSIGLQDETAAEDLRDLRGTLKMLRAVKQTIFRQIIDRLVTAMIVAAATYFVARGGER